MQISLRTLAAAPLLILTLAVPAQQPPLVTPGQPKQPSTTPTSHTNWPAKDELYVAHNFRFGTGETLPELKLRYLTLGTPHRNAGGHVDNAILLLHGTGGERHTLLVPQFSNELFGPGQPFDITKYFLILPDDIGQGDSSKPSDGLHMRFPKYDYDDMVRSQYLMLTEGLHVDHLRLILGTSMGCMQGFVWGETYPGYMDALAPFACLPTELAGRNRMMRYMAITDIKTDPAWQNGEYKSEPTLGLRGANEMLLVMGSSPLQMQKAAPTRKAAEEYVDKYLDRTDRPHRRQQPHLLRRRQPQLQPRAEARRHQGSRPLHQLRRRLHQPTRARHRRTPLEKDQPTAASSSSPPPTPPEATEPTPRQPSGSST